MSTELRPTPETDAAFLKIYAGYLTPPATIDLQKAEKFARGLERQRDEARESLERSCDDEHGLTEEVSKLIAQRDQLLAALEKVEFYGATGCLQDSLDEAKRIARAAIAAVKGGGK